MKGRLMRSIAKLLCLTVGVGSVAAPMIACGNKDKGGKALLLATDALDTNFNPFFYTSGADGEIVSQTQIGMLSSDEKGQLIANWNEPCVALAYGKVKHGSPDEVQGNNYGNYGTDYYFALKDDIKFSDGELLTKDDVLFNIYMYLDPAYTGSNTMYSVKIKGLTEYRTQTRNLDDADGAESFFQTDVDGRLQAILSWIEDESEPTWEDLAEYEYYGAEDKTIESDINKIQEYYRQSLNETWTAVSGADIDKEYEKYIDQNGNRIITEPWQLFMLNYSLLTLEEHYDRNTMEIDYYIPKYANESVKHDQASLVNYEYNRKFAGQKSASDEYKGNLYTVMMSYPVNVYMSDYLLSDVKHRKFKDNMDVKSVSGIEILPKQSTIPNQIDKGNNVLEDETITLKDKAGNPKAYDVLRIKINGVDPKAIQNFAFTVAPGHYYSTKEAWNKAVKDTTDQENFGVDFSDPEFMNKVREKMLPMGAGPFYAAKSSGGKASTKSDFFGSSNIVYFESNKNFMLGEPKIKKLRYKVISNSQLYNAVKTGDVHYALPSMKSEDINTLEREDKKNLNYAFTDNLGYGYIGVSARYIPNIYIRQAIMTTFDTSLISSYYGQGASVINRPMSKTLTEYYPFDAEAPYPFNSETVKDDVKALLEAGGCTSNNGVWYDEKGKKMKYTFTIAGDSDDHPANQIFIKSQGILNDLGLEITVSHDSNALSKLASGLLTVWAAAWSSSSDPDMYQVYHKDSQATSITAWGYRYVFSSEFKELDAKNNKYGYDDQRTMINDLSELIDQGRETDVTSIRKDIYTKALDKLMELAVEFPTYQRRAYYIWRKGVFKESTLVSGADVTSYQSPLSRIWEVELA